MIDHVLAMKAVLSFKESEQVKVPHVLQWRMNVCTSNHIFNLTGTGKKKLIELKEVREWCSKYDASVIRLLPRCDLTECYWCILNAGQKPNPLQKDFLVLVVFPVSCAET